MRLRALGLFLREFRSSATQVPVQSTGLSEWSGVALVALGVLVTLSATVRHFQLIRELAAGDLGAGSDIQGRDRVGADTRLDGAVMAGYLIFVR